MTLHSLDATRLLCPMPVIKVQERVASLQPGDRLRVTFTDPGALHDIPAWSRVNGHRVVQTEAGDLEGFVIIEIGACD